MDAWINDHLVLHCAVSANVDVHPACGVQLEFVVSAQRRCINQTISVLDRSDQRITIYLDSGD
jgi:hypothetical protein